VIRCHIGKDIFFFGDGDALFPWLVNPRNLLLCPGVVDLPSF